MDMELNRRFDHHAPTPEVVEQHEQFRARCKTLATIITNNLPEGREKSLTLTKLEEVLFWGNAAIARYNAKD